MIHWRHIQVEHSPHELCFYRSALAGKNGPVSLCGLGTCIPLEGTLSEEMLQYLLTGMETKYTQSSFSVKLLVSYESVFESQ